MPDGFTMKLDGLENVLNNIGQFSAEVQSELNIEITALANEIAAEAIAKAPVDLGALRNSIRAFPSKDGQAQVVALAHYSPYIEFGTGTKIDIPTGPGLEDLGTYALQFKGKGIKKINLPARQFFFPAVSRGATRLIPILQNIINNAANRL